MFVELLRDVSYRLAPANADELHAMIRDVRGYAVLAGARGQATADLDAIARTLQAVAWVLNDFPEIVEIDLNPVLAGPQAAVVADGRATLADETKGIAHERR